MTDDRRVSDTFKRAFGDNLHALLRPVYRILKNIAEFPVWLLPHQSTRRTVLKEADDCLYLVYKGCREEAPLVGNSAYESEVRQLFRGLLNEGDTAIDIGANCGLHTTLLSRIVGPQGQVHSFEPVDYNIRKLTANTLLNGARNVALHPYALGNETARMKMRVIREDAYWVGSSSLVENEKMSGRLLGKFDEVEVEVKRLDDIVDAYQLKVDLIKIGVEGFEYQVLEGAQKTILEQQPAIIIEFFPERHRHLGQSREDFKRLLEPYDAYEILEKSVKDRYTSMEPYNFDRDPTGANLLLLSRQRILIKETAKEV